MTKKLFLLLLGLLPMTVIAQSESAVKKWIKEGIADGVRKSGLYEAYTNRMYEKTDQNLVVEYTKKNNVVYCGYFKWAKSKYWDAYGFYFYPLTDSEEDNAQLRYNWHKYQINSINDGNVPFQIPSLSDYKSKGSAYLIPQYPSGRGRSLVYALANMIKWTGDTKDDKIDGEGIGYLSQFDEDKERSFVIFKGKFDQGVPIGDIMFIAAYWRNTWKPSICLSEIISYGKFYDGMAMIKKGGLTGFYNEKYEMVYPPVFTDAENFKAGVAKVTRQGKLNEVLSGKSAVPTYIDKNGKELGNKPEGANSALAERKALDKKEEDEKYYSENKDAYNSTPKYTGSVEDQIKVTKKFVGLKLAETVWYDHVEYLCYPNGEALALKVRKATPSISLTKGDIVIRDKVKGRLKKNGKDIYYTVTGIHTFEGAEITSVTIPNTVRYCGIFTGVGEDLNSGFKNCKQLKEVIVKPGDNELFWGTSTFENCTSLERVPLELRAGRIPDGMFRNCTSLKEAKIPIGVQSIGTGAFSGCSNLEWLNISNTVKKIGTDVFNGCTKIKTLTIPDKFLEYAGNGENQVLETQLKFKDIKVRDKQYDVYSFKDFFDKDTKIFDEIYKKSLAANKSIKSVSIDPFVDVYFNRYQGCGGDNITKAMEVQDLYKVIAALNFTMPDKYWGVGDGLISQVFDRLIFLEKKGKEDLDLLIEAEIITEKPSAKCPYKAAYKQIYPKIMQKKTNLKNKLQQDIEDYKAALKKQEEERAKSSSSSSPSASKKEIAKAIDEGRMPYPEPISSEKDWIRNDRTITWEDGTRGTLFCNIDNEWYIAPFGGGARRYYISYEHGVKALYLYKKYDYEAKDGRKR